MPPSKTPGERMVEMFHFKDATPEQKVQVQSIRDAYEKFAKELVDCTPSGPEQTVALRYLLESKDCAVRAVLFPL